MSRALRVAHLVATSLCAARVLVDPSSLHLIDEAGRPRIFHGVNLVAKTAPYLPSTGTRVSRF